MLFRIFSFRSIFLVSGREKQCFHRVAIGSHSVCDLSHATSRIPRGLIDLGRLIKKLSAEIILAIEGKNKSRVLHKLSWIKFDLGKYIFISLVWKHAIPRTSRGRSSIQ